jgi:hypothetical protein
MGVSYFVMLSISQGGNVVMNKSVCFMNYEIFLSLLLGTQNSATKFVGILSQQKKWKCVIVFTFTRVFHKSRVWKLSLECSNRMFENVLARILASEP